MCSTRMVCMAGMSACIWRSMRMKAPAVCMGNLGVGLAHRQTAVWLVLLQVFTKGASTERQIRIVQHWLADAGLLVLAPVSQYRAATIPYDSLIFQIMHFANLYDVCSPNDYQVVSKRGDVRLYSPVTKKQQRLQQAALADVFDRTCPLNLVSHWSQASPQRHIRLMALCQKVRCYCENLPF